MKKNNFLDTWQLVVVCRTENMSYLHISVTFLILLRTTWVAGEESSRELEKDILQKVFMASKFNIYVRPDENGTENSDKPLQVSVSLYILNSEIDIKNRECSLQMYFRQEWNDSRLAYDDKGKVKVLSLHDAVGFWTPDLFFVNEKSGHLHALTKLNTFVRIKPQGKVQYSQRVSVKLPCPMDLRKYPFDTQVCILSVESYGYTSDDLILKWKPETTFGINEPSGYRVLFASLEDIVHVGDHDYSRIELFIHFTRLFHAVFLHVYLPLGLLVIITWFSFFIPSTSHLPRMVFILISTFSTVCFLQSVNEFIYHEHYLTALDLWIGFSCLIIFGVVFENIYVVATQNNLNTKQDDGTTDQVPELKKAQAGGLVIIKEILSGKATGNASHLDGICKLLFPCVYVLFNIIYFAFYLF